jgi:hypothetical protein
MMLPAGTADGEAITTETLIGVAESELVDDSASVPV